VAAFYTKAMEHPQKSSSQSNNPHPSFRVQSCWSQAGVGTCFVLEQQPKSNKSTITIKKRMRIVLDLGCTPIFNETIRSNIVILTHGHLDHVAGKYYTNNMSCFNLFIIAMLKSKFYRNAICQVYSDMLVLTVSSVEGKNEFYKVIYCFCLSIALRLRSFIIYLCFINTANIFCKQNRNKTEPNKMKRKVNPDVLRAVCFSTNTRKGKRLFFRHGWLMSK